MRTMLDLVLEMGEERGVDRGRQEGRQEGVRGVLRSLLEARFGTIPPTAAARIAEADLESLQRWSLRVLDATQLDEALED